MQATSRKGFTLIELLVVIAIISILMGLLIPAVQKVRQAANRIVCANNLKQLGLAAHNYHDSHGSFPPGYTAQAAYFDGASDTLPGWGWGAYLLPYIEQDNLQKTINFNLAVSDPSNAAAIAYPIKTYLCPADLTPNRAFTVPDAFGNPVALAAASSYAGCVGGDESEVTDFLGMGCLYRNSHIRFADITDGSSNTLLIGERAWSNARGMWAGPVVNGVLIRGGQNPNPGSPRAFLPAAALNLAHGHLINGTGDTDGGLDDFSSLHTGGANFLFADGSVHFIRAIPADTLTGFTPDSIAFQALATRAGGEVIQGFDY